MPITPDQQIIWQWGFVHLNATIVCTWIVMLLLTIVSWRVTRSLAPAHMPRSQWQNALEVVVQTIRNQIREICPEEADRLLPFVGTLFVFIAACSLLEIVPGWRAPTGSLSTTAALALSVAVAVHVFGVLRRGVMGYLQHYIRPTFLMLPFHLLTEMTRTLALAVRLFGNIMSESTIVGILLVIAPLAFPMIMQVFGLLMGLIQAYVFSILATVYIAAAVQAQRDREGATYE
jgi:F-type H+-transporting ATPase subunit a